METPGLCVHKYDLWLYIVVASLPCRWSLDVIIRTVWNCTLLGCIVTTHTVSHCSHCSVVKKINGLHKWGYSRIYFHLLVH